MHTIARSAEAIDVMDGINFWRQAQKFPTKLTSTTPVLFFLHRLHLLRCHHESTPTTRFFLQDTRWQTSHDTTHARCHRECSPPLFHPIPISQLSPLPSSSLAYTLRLNQLIHPSGPLQSIQNFSRRSRQIRHSTHLTRNRAERFFNYLHLEHITADHKSGI